MAAVAQVATTTLSRGSARRSAEGSRKAPTPSSQLSCGVPCSGSMSEGRSSRGLGWRGEAKGKGQVKEQARNGAFVGCCVSKRLSRMCGSACSAGGEGLAVRLWRCCPWRVTHLTALPTWCRRTRASSRSAGGRHAAASGTAGRPPSWRGLPAAAPRQGRCGAPGWAQQVVREVPLHLGWARMYSAVLRFHYVPTQRDNLVTMHRCAPGPPPPPESTSCRCPGARR